MLTNISDDIFIGVNFKSSVVYEKTTIFLKRKYCQKRSKTHHFSKLKKDRNQKMSHTDKAHHAKLPGPNRLALTLPKVETLNEKVQISNIANFHQQVSIFSKEGRCNRYQNLARKCSKTFLQKKTILNNGGPLTNTIFLRQKTRKIASVSFLMMVFMICNNVQKAQTTKLKMSKLTNIFKRYFGKSKIPKIA